ncbi:MAG: tRNA (5-methylaminomethyl-2-thiouridylate)-methyltransferase [Gammaproteobacteria bacterium]|nr:tRNA (5-methylaminomethyl-2-thiouridylate)-methyltransferase [Gammaproteobacteria bacterium]
MINQRKAVALISGGLDSMLAARVILEQGIHVEGINFFTGFCVEGHTHAIRQKDKQKNKRNNALWVAEQLGIKLHIIDIVDEYKEIVINPKHGYGTHLNPCLDCKIFMIKSAYKWLQEANFDFIITGEVIGQRPKSQTKNKMPLIAKQSGANDRLLRPLCAKNLPATLPELEGWVDREKLYGFTGRGRKQQFHLANQFEFKDFAQPAGGCCFLTDKYYSEKLRDFWEHRSDKNYELDDVMLLKVGRHLRPRENFKMIIGREEGENNFLEGYRKQFVHLRIMSHTGPLILIDGSPNREDISLAAEIAARFSGGREAEKVTIQVHNLDGSLMVLNVKPFSSQDIPQEWYVG